MHRVRGWWSPKLLRHAGWLSSLPTPAIYTACLVTSPGLRNFESLPVSGSLYLQAHSLDSNRWGYCSLDEGLQFNICDSLEAGPAVEGKLSHTRHLWRVAGVGY